MRLQLQCLLESLSIEFQKSVVADSTDVGSSLVVLQGVSQGLFDLLVRLVGRHVDEVDDDETAQIPQAKLASYLSGGLEVGMEGRFLLGLLLGGAS